MPIPTPSQVFQKSPQHATYNFNQDSHTLYRSQPRFPFEYYINFNLNQVGSAKQFISTFFDTSEFSKVMPLVKSVDMPSMKIETTPLNQYNRKRLSQTSIKFEPVKIVFHDVADGLTLQFWEMYYRYYFADGSEPGINTHKQGGLSNSLYSYSREKITGGRDTQNIDLSSSAESPTNTDGDKRAMQNIIADKLNNHNFGFNLSTVKNIRNLIQDIEIYQVHGGLFNRVTLVNPRISAFTHDVLSYAVGDKTLELTFVVEYEYAFYTIQNMKLGGSESNNNSSLEQFSHGETLELPESCFNAQLSSLIKSKKPQLYSDNSIIQRVGKNLQSSLTGVVAADAGLIKPGHAPAGLKRTSASSLSGLVQVSPSPTTGLQDTIASAKSIFATAKTIVKEATFAASQARSFASTAKNVQKTIQSIGSELKTFSKNPSLSSADSLLGKVDKVGTLYKDMDRISGRSGPSV